MISYNQLANEDTIVALATPQGKGAIGVIRLSGKEAINICQKVWKGKDLTQQPSHTIHFGYIKNNDEVIDEVVVSLFKEPKSYTKENVVEISCHGSQFIQQKIINALTDAGARHAQPGEFTLRAFMNGRFDLSQAEAVADLIASDSASSHQVALQQMRGGFSNQIKLLREQLINFTALIELELDFGEEDVEFANRNDLKNLVASLVHHISGLINSFKLGNVIKNGVNTVIAGRPNAGKSTLLNALLREERAIVSDIPGTTRDVIEEVLNIDGINFRLIDTAGIREATDAIEKIGIERTMQKIRQSALVVYLFDVNNITAKEVEADLKMLNAHDIPLITVGNKIDLITEAEAQQKFQAIENIIFISSKNHLHLENLKNTLVQKVVGSQLNFNDTIVTNARHYEALQQAKAALDDVMQGIYNHTTGDLLSLDIRRALSALGAITGDIDVDRDILGTIFGKFCIGK
jgi:tRNA modification GTPase